MKVEKLEKQMDIPQGVDVIIEGTIIKVKGQKGEVKREIKNPRIVVEKKDNSVVVFSKDATKREKKEVFTYAAHMKNMFRGVSEGHSYELAVCSGHFPMNVSVAGEEFIIKNFIGGKSPKKLRLKEGVSVKVEGDRIIVEHTSKEVAGQTAADIERMTRRPGFDTRIFQDGIYITKKDGKNIS